MPGITNWSGGRLMLLNRCSVICFVGIADSGMRISVRVRSYRRCFTAIPRYFSLSLRYLGCSYPFTLAVDKAMSCMHHFSADDMNSLSLSQTKKRRRLHLRNDVLVNACKHIDLIEKSKYTEIRLHRGMIENEQITSYK